MGHETDRPVRRRNE